MFLEGSGVPSRLLLVLGLALTLAGAASAAPALKPVYAQPASWVDVAPLPPAPDLSDAPAVQTVLDDNQSRLGPDGDAYYNRRAWKILKPEGLRRFTSMSISWEPEKETLVVHHLRIVRAGETIDLLGKGQKMLVLRREQNLERAQLDGRMSASQQLEDIRVGDIIDWSYTLTRKDPILAGRSYDQEGLSFTGPAARYRVVVDWPERTTNQWRTTAGFGEPSVSVVNGRKQLLVDRHDIEAPKPPAGAPARFRRLGTLETSGFASWREVSKLMAPLYATAAALPASSELKQEAAAIRATHATEDTRAFAALQLVEEKTRYFFLGLGDGGYVPAPAELTWQRKFGDCKGKTALLLALLRELDIQAEPALVNAGGGDGLNERLPSLGAFNHVVVRATIGGKVYWLDGTRTGDRSGLQSLRPPSHRWALPVRADGAELESIVVPPYPAPTMEVLIRMDASAGIEAPAPTRMTMTFRGEAASAFRARLAVAPRADLERTLRQSLGASPEFELENIEWKDAPEDDRLDMVITGKTAVDWRYNSDVKQQEYRVAVGGPMRVSFPKRGEGPNQDAPYALAFPAHARTVTEVVLPNKGKGFTVRGPNLDQVLAGTRHQRTSELADGVARFVTDTRAMQQEISAADALAAMEAGKKRMVDDSVIRAPS